MKYFYVSLLLLFLSNSALAQVQMRKATPADFHSQGKFKTQKAAPAAIGLKDVDVPALVEEDKRDDANMLGAAFLEHRFHKSSATLGSNGLEK